MRSFNLHFRHFLALLLFFFNSILTASIIAFVVFKLLFRGMVGMF